MENGFLPGKEVIHDMPENRYDNTTISEGNATEQASRVATQQQRGNDQQQQAQAAQRAAAPDVAVQLQQTQPEREVRQQQKTGQGMSIW